MTPKQSLNRIQRLIAQAQLAIDAALPGWTTDKVAASELAAAKANLQCAVGHVQGVQSRVGKRGGL